MRGRSASWVLALLVPVASCGTDTGTLDVLLQTELVAGSDFLRVRAELYDGLPEEGGHLSDRPQEAAAAPGTSYASPRRVAQFGPLLSGTWAARVELLTSSGRVLAARTVAAAVNGSSEIVVEIDEQDLVGGGLPCETGVDPGTVALYTFDADGGGTSITDGTGANHGAMVGAALEAIAGPEGCGQALAFPDTGEVYGEIPSADAFQLESGSIELWVRPHAPAATSIQGIIGRDAMDAAQPGHVALWLAPDRRVIARLQNPDGTATRCSNEPLAIDRWAHVGINFGPEGFDLWVDGTRTTYTGDVVVNPDPMNGWTIRCGGGSVRGIAGNANPWVLGASTGNSVEGSATPVNGYFRGGAIDHLRIASDRREFGR